MIIFLPMVDNDNDTNTHNITFIIIGAGPVGLATALLLAKKGYRSTLYEAQKEILNDPEQSYPIGVNCRGLNTLAEINVAIEKEIKETGRVIDSWQIFAGSRRVAMQESGVVFGTSRAKVNLVLLEAARKSPLIKILFNHKLIDINFESKELEFEQRESVNSNSNNNASSKTKFIIKINNDKIISTDGVNSVVRRKMVEKFKDFTCEVIPWTNEYRVLFAEPGVMSDELDTKVHYIFNGCYAAVIENQNKEQWTLVLSTKDSDSESNQRLILSNEPSKENITALLKYIKSNASKFLPFFENNENELQRFFSRRSYRGAIVNCSRFNHKESVLLMGDSAHSVLPPTGEGINSGLEDAFYLYNCLNEKGVNNIFENYNKIRKPQISGLWEYAKYLNEDPQFPGEGFSRIAFTILSGCFKRKIFNELFGKESIKRLPYQDISSSWQTKKLWILNSVRIIAYPIALCFFIIMPWRWGICCKKKNARPVVLKPPINEN